MKAYILEFRKKSKEFNNPVTRIVYGAIEYRKIVEYMLANISYEIHNPEAHWWWKVIAIELDCELANAQPKITYDEPRYFDWNANEMPFEPLIGYFT